MMPGMGGMDPRQMSMMMKKLGIDVRDIEGVEQVLVRTATKDYVFDKATVSVMKAQGVETWQVSGKPRTVERGAGATAASPATGAASKVSPSTGTPPPADAIPDTEAGYEPTADDIALVAKETGKPAVDARKALVDTKGDLAEAILRLSI